MKIVVDFDLCESNGMCERIAPDVFHIDENDLLQVNHDNVTEDRREDLEDAVATCPRAAIALVG